MIFEHCVYRYSLNCMMSTCKNKISFSRRFSMIRILTYTRDARANHAAYFYTYTDIHILKFFSHTMIRDFYVADKEMTSMCARASFNDVNPPCVRLQFLLPSCICVRNTQKFIHESISRRNSTMYIYILDAHDARHYLLCALFLQSIIYRVFRKTLKFVDLLLTLIINTYINLTYFTLRLQSSIVDFFTKIPKIYF